MPAFGLIVAGRYDAAVLKVFLQRLRPDVSVELRTCGNDFRVTTTFGNVLKTLRYSNQGGPVNKAIVVRDAHGLTQAQVMERFRENFEPSEHSFPVEFAVIVPELEAWLLSDHEALISASAVRGQGQNFYPIDRSPEEIGDPKTAVGIAPPRCGCSLYGSGGCRNRGANPHRARGAALSKLHTV